MQPKTNLTLVDFPTVVALRAGESFEIEPWTGDPGDMARPTYAVALFEAPDLAKLNIAISPTSDPTGLALVGLTAEGWGWLPVEPNTKEMIGKLLDTAGAKPGEWYRLIINYAFPYLA